MKLIDDLIEPTTLTGYSREEVDKFDATGATLADLFPNVVSDSTFVEWTVGGRNEDVAEFRAFDAEAMIGGTSGMETRTARLPAISLKRRFGELEQLLRMGQGAPETVEAAAERLALEVARGVVRGLVKRRGEALATGKLEIDENGFKQSVDFGRKKEHTATASELWSTGGDPVADLETWRDAYEAENGVAPSRLLVSRKVMSVLVRHTALRAYLGGSAPSMVAQAEVAEILQSHGLPAPEVFSDRVGGAPVLPENGIILAAPGAGFTGWGTTVEASKPNYGFAGLDMPGLVVGAYESEDPAMMWVRANAIAMPVLANPNLTFAATVVA